MENKCHRACQAERASRAGMEMFVSVGVGGNGWLCLHQRTQEGTVGSQPREGGVRYPMKDPDCQVRVWLSFWKHMASLGFFEQLRAKMNLRARRVKTPLMGRTEKGRETQGEKGRVTCSCI